MDDFSQLGPLGLLGDADPVPQGLLLSSAEQAKTLALLYDVSRELTSILDREELFRRIAHRIKKIVNYHVFTVMLWNEKSQLLEGVFAMHYNDSIPARFRVPLHRGITGIAAGERRSIRVGDVASDPRYVNCDECTSIDLDVRSELVVPLLLQDRLIGVLDLESTVLNAFTEEHERMLVTLGSYIAIALENARLYAESRESEQRLRDDLDTAREIQRQLLPTGAREVPGLDLAAAYVPARELGGDFYDFLPYGEGKIALGLGDVSGKGTAAALYGSLAIGTLRELVVDHAMQPAEMLTVLNQRMVNARLDAKFIAMVFAVFDASTRRLTFANGGGPYPLLVRNGVTQEMELGGIPLGLLSAAEYDETTVDLQPGDIVIFASDGILESENSEHEQFGADRLNALLANVSPTTTANEITEQILAATDDHSGLDTTPHDDRTLIVMRLNDEDSSDFSKLPIIY